MGILKYYYTFRGTMSLRNFWLTGILPGISTLLVTLILDMAVLRNNEAPTLSLILLIVMQVPCLSFLIRRCHDRNRSGHFLWFLLIPLLNAWPIIELLFVPGKPTNNRFDNISPVYSDPLVDAAIFFFVAVAAPISWFLSVCYVICTVICSEPYEEPTALAFFEGLKNDIGTLSDGLAASGTPYGVQIFFFVSTLSFLVLRSFIALKNKSGLSVAAYTVLSLFTAGIWWITQTYPVICANFAPPAENLSVQDYLGEAPTHTFKISIEDVIRGSMGISTHILAASSLYATGFFALMGVLLLKSEAKKSTIAPPPLPTEHE